ncbi:MAG: DUF2786 domain-containing protein [Helicobacteraceae bacterium]|jgi:hypothetical protein|nr:DUF2786 domain-containing protein [Helicobacteraceae bacterium]
MTQEIKEKIRKLLALASSDNPNEAKLAAKRAVELMNRYGLTESDLDSEPFADITRHYPYKRAPSWYKMMWSAMSYYSGCVAIWTRSSSAISVFGRRCDAENAVYLVDCLRQEADRKAEAYKNALRQRGERIDRTKLNDYLMGFVTGVATSLAKAQRDFFIFSNDNKKAIVPIDRRYEESLLEIEGKGKIRSIKVSKPKNKNSFIRGANDGKSVGLHKGVSGEAIVTPLSDRRLNAIGYAKLQGEGL